MKSTTHQVLIWCTNGLFFLSLFVSTILIGFQVYNLIQRDHEVNYSFGTFQSAFLTEADTAKIAVVAKSSKVASAHLVAGKWNLNFNTKDSRVKAVVAIATTVQIIFVLLPLFLIRKFVYSLRRGSPFSLQNVVLLKRTGCLLLLAIPLEWVGGKIISYWINQYFVINEKVVSSSYKLGFTIGNSSFNWNWLLAGLLVLVIAEVFKQGLVMKEEQELTI